jgi:multidrug resistance efflux pump
VDFAVDVRPDQAWSSIVQSISAAKGADSSILPAQNGLTGISDITRGVA